MKREHGQSDSDGEGGQYGYTPRDRGTRGQEPLRLPRGPFFDGTGKWKTFYTKFNSFAIEANWSQYERRRRLCWLTQGKASDFYAHVLEQDLEVTYNQLIEQIARRFDFRDITKNLILEFQRAKQKQDESLPEWGQWVVDLAYDAFKHMDDAHMYKMAVKRFCQGIFDKDATIYAAYVCPRTIEKAIENIRNCQHNGRQIYGKPKSVR